MHCGPYEASVFILDSIASLTLVTRICHYGIILALKTDYSKCKNANFFPCSTLRNSDQTLVQGPSSIRIIHMSLLCIINYRAEHAVISTEQYLFQEKKLYSRLTVEEIGVKSSLNNTRHNSDGIYSILCKISVYPIRDIQTPVETESKQIMRGDGFGFSCTLHHEELW